MHVQSRPWEHNSVFLQAKSQKWIPASSNIAARFIQSEQMGRYAGQY